MNYKDKIIDLLVKQTGLSKEEVSKVLAVPPNPELGDYAFPCFKLGNPKEAAEKKNKEINSLITFGSFDYLWKTAAQGPYLNFFLNQKTVGKEILSKIHKEKREFGKSKTDKETVMVEFFHANTHKGVHIGHIRNISIGASIANLQEAIGKKVIRANYFGDIGPHVAKCLWGYMYFKEKEPKEKKGIWLGKIYAKASQEIKGNEQYEQEVKDLNTKIYQKDKSVYSLWKKTRKWCYQDFDVFYKEFGVKFDRLYPESEVQGIGKEEFFKLLEKGIAKKSDGAIIMDLEEYGLGVYVAITGQGNPTYQGKEMGLATLKLKEFKFDKSIHVVGSEQELFFKQMFKTLELAGSPIANKSKHVSYGLVNLPEGKMSSRLGTMILYDTLIEKLLELSEQEITKRHKNLSAKEVKKRAAMISFGALKYGMIARENHKNMTFDWTKALDFEGDTGPYIQYAHARCASILRKTKQKINTKVHYEALDSAHERKVILHLAKFEETVMMAAEQYKPYILAKYCLDLAQAFNEFYHHCPVISNLTEVMHARLLLVSCVKQVLKNGLGLLGIDAPEEM